MKKLLISLLGMAALVACTSSQDPVQQKLNAYANVEVGSHLYTGISENGKQVLDYYKMAADEADNIFWDQSFGDKAAMSKVPTSTRPT